MNNDSGLWGRFRVVEGTLADYRRLECFHYRQPHRGPFAAVYALKRTEYMAEIAAEEAVGVIAYINPVPAMQMRTVALGGYLSGLDRASQMGVINRDIRCISRVIVDPRLRSLGFASRLVRETMPLMNVPVIETQAVMGRVHPFFERAGMTPFPTVPAERCVRMTEALAMVGIEDETLVDPQFVQRRLDSLDAGRAAFIESEIRVFLSAYGKRRHMQPGIERTTYFLSKLGDRGVYYVWFNPKLTGFESPPQPKPSIPAGYVTHDDVVAAFIGNRRS